MNPLRDILANTSWLEIALTALDLIIVYYIIYRALLLIKGTRAVQMLIGLMAIILFSLASKEEYLNLPTVHWMLDTFLGSFLLIIIVIFQDDIRRGLSQVGRTSLFAERSSRIETQLLEEVIKASHAIAQQGNGALIVIEREADLTPWLDSGITLEAQVTRQLLSAIFVPERANPLHDGAAIIRQGRLRAAGCLLPLSNNPEIERHLGTRHRAALGISEQTDAAVIIVSEETGMVSVAWKEELIRGLDLNQLRDLLHHIFGHDKHTHREPAPESREPGALLSWLRARRATPPDETTHKEGP